MGRRINRGGRQARRLGFLDRRPMVPMDTCPLCHEPVRFARSAKGFVEVLSKRPTSEGWIHVEEGFTHVFEDHDAAVHKLARSGFRKVEINLYELHFCDPARLRRASPTAPSPRRRGPTLRKAR